MAATESPWTNTRLREGRSEQAGLLSSDMALRLASVRNEGEFRDVLARLVEELAAAR